jgi:hypothetical protein
MYPKQTSTTRQSIKKRQAGEISWRSQLLGQSTNSISLGRYCLGRACSALVIDW